MQDAAVIAGQVVLRRLTCPILEGAWTLPCCSLNRLSSYTIRRSLWSAQSHLGDKGKCFLATRESQGRFFLGLSPILESWTESEQGLAELMLSRCVCGVGGGGVNEQWMLIDADHGW